MEQAARPGTSRMEEEPNQTISSMTPTVQCKGEVHDLLLQQQKRLGKCFCICVSRFQEKKYSLSFFYAYGPRLINKSDCPTRKCGIKCLYVTLYNACIKCLYNVLYKIFFWKIFFSYRPIKKNPRKLLETTIFFFQP